MAYLTSPNENNNHDSMPIVNKHNNKTNKQVDSIFHHFTNTSGSDCTR